MFKIFRRKKLKKYKEAIDLNFLNLRLENLEYEFYSLIPRNEITTNHKRTIDALRTRYEEFKNEVESNVLNIEDINPIDYDKDFSYDRNINIILGKKEFKLFQDINEEIFDLYYDESLTESFFINHISIFKNKNLKL